jgi:hypothetical protein
VYSQSRLTLALNTEGKVLAFKFLVGTVGVGVPSARGRS